MIRRAVTKLEVFKARLATFNDLCKRCRNVYEGVERDYRTTRGDRDLLELARATAVKRMSRLSRWYNLNQLILPDEVSRAYFEFFSAVHKIVGPAGTKVTYPTHAAVKACFDSYYNVFNACRAALALTAITTGTERLLRQHAEY